MEVVARAFMIVDRLSRSPDGKTLSQLAGATNLPPPTVHRLLNSLAELKMVERDELSKRWHLGPGFIRIALGISGGGAAETAANRLLEQLRDTWNECFFVVVLAEDHCVCIHVVETSGSQRITVSVPLGRELALHASASAKAILAELPAVEAKRLLRTAPRRRYTDKTLTGVAEVIEDLRRTRARGYAICDEELEPGVCAYAVTIGNGTGPASRSLGVIGPRERLVGQVEDGLLEDLSAAAKNLATLRG